MSLRTYIRTLFNDILKKNIIVLLFTKIVNFCCSIGLKSPNAIKFEQNIPTKGMEKRIPLFFQSVTGDKLDCK